MAAALASCIAVLRQSAASTKQAGGRVLYSHHLAQAALPVAAIHPQDAGQLTLLIQPEPVSP